MTRWLSALTLTLTLTIAAHAQVPPDKALATMKPADGFQVELFAAEPMLMNPTSMDVDHKGRVWITEAVNYRRLPPYNRPILRPEGDRIVVLIDKTGAGKATEAVTFYQGKDIYGPLGICVAPIPASPDRKGGAEGLRVFVCQSPDILVFEDRDGDLKADGPPKKFLTGFNGFDHDHGVHGINIGPDGKLYFTVGDAGVKNLQSADGKGPKFTSNATDCRAGTVWRCDMDGNNLELIAHNFRNNYECCVDSFGEIWLSDNDDDGNQQTRICFVMPGGNYGYHPRGPGQTHWHEEQPGIVHKTLRTGFGSPTGIAFYEGSLFPKKYAGALLHCDAGPREVRAFFRKPKGAGYELEKELLLTSTDNYFRPSDVCVAPDGSIFVADWYDRGVGGHGMGDPWDGRIYRLTPKGHKGYKVPEVKLDKPEGVMAALSSPNLAVRHLARAMIRGMTFDKAGAFFAPIERPEEGTQAHTLLTWAIIPLFTDPKQLLNYLQSEPHTDQPAAGTDYRIAATNFDRIAGQGSRLYPFILKWLNTATLDPKKKTVLRETIPPTPGDYATFAKFVSLPVAREALLLMRKLEPKGDFNTLFYALAKKYDGQDIFYRAALNIACGTDPARRDAILADFDKHFPEWNDKVADLVWELRPKSVLPRLAELLADAKLTGPQKARIIDILAASDDPAAGQTMLAVLKSDAPAEVKTAALAQLRLFLPTKWKGLQTSKELAAAIDGLLADPKTQVTGLQLVAAASATTQAAAVAKIAADEKAAAEVRTEAVRTLGKLRAVQSVEALKAIATAPTRDPAPKLHVEAVNTLAALVTGSPKDDISPKALAVLQGIVTGTASVELKKATVEALAGTFPGSQWLLEMHAKGELPKELVADTGRLLRNSPFQPVRNKALLAFPAPGKLNPKALPPIAELAKRTGDAGRGKQAWDASLAGAAQCAKCHMVRGVGGQVGPDLSMIGKKGSKENLFESILIPSKAIADQYIQQSITTTADVTISGLLVSDTPQAVTLRDANGKDTTIARGDIQTQKKLQVSIMPEDIVAALNEDELVDLVAYLETLQTAALTPDAFHIVGPFKAKDMATALKTEFGPEKGAGPDAKGKTIRPDGKGYFDLAALHGTEGNNSASYMHVEIESPVDQDAELLLGTDDGAKLWLNGKDVFATEQVRAAAPGQDTVKVKLVKGSNIVLLKVANGNNPHGFYFSLLSQEETKVATKK